MVNRFLNFIGREYNGLHEAAFLLGFSAFGSQILALIRDRLLASSFGAGAELDIYYAAFRLPDLLFVFFGSLVSVTVVLPFLYRHLTAGDQAAANRLFTDLARWFLISILLAIAVVYFLMPRLLNLTAPGFDPTARAELLILSRLLLLSPLLLGLSNLLANITQSSRKFFSLCPKSDSLQPRHHHRPFIFLPATGSGRTGLGSHSRCLFASGDSVAGVFSQSIFVSRDKIFPRRRDENNQRLAENFYFSLAANTGSLGASINNHGAFSFSFLLRRRFHRRF